MPSATLRADGNGLLSVDEVAKDVHRLGLVIPDGEVGKNKLFAKLDTDSSRTVTMVEFLPFVLKYSPDTRDAKVTDPLPCKSQDVVLFTSVTAMTLPGKLPL